MFPKQNLERKLNVQIATSGVMDNAISLWLQMYENKPPWMGGEADTRTMNLPAAIAEEFSRLILTEFEFKLEGSARADFLNDQFQNYLSNFDNIVEMWAALGGIAIKPYVSGSDPLTGKPDKIQLDFIQANRFYPTAFNSNKEITGAVFIDSKRVGDYLYTRLEHHNLEGDHYTVVNKAYRSERLNTMTTEDDHIRDSSMFKGLDELLRRVEFLCGLAYGTLSNPNQVDRTATEIKASKQRSYTTVSNMQKAWNNGLDGLIEIMNTLCDLYGITPAGEIQKLCSWGDGVLEDTEVEYQRRWSMVLAGKLKIEKFYAWYFGCTEEEAKEYIPEENTYPPEE